MNFFNNNNNGTPSRLASLRPNFMRSSSNKAVPPAAKQQATDNVPVLLYCAAQCLSNTIEEILSDTSNLVGDNLSGFQRLLDILNDESTSDDMVHLSSSGGRACLQTMLDNIAHPKFIEICNQAALATALMHALRLIRMLEIKKCKLMATNPAEVEHITTFKTTERVSKIMKFLCTDLKTIEQIKQSIVKLLIFPLGVLPATALHIQDQSAAIVSTLCKTGFSSQQVWFLHDVQAITHMVRHLNELTVLEGSNDVASPRRNSNSGKLSAQSPLALVAAAAATEGGGDELLRGLSAEQKGMWIVGVQCLVEVIACTLSISSVLMSDFEAAGGNKLFIHMMKHSSPERFMVLINIVTQLMFDPEKTADEAMISTSAGSILIDFLREVLHLRQSIKLDQSVESLMVMAETIFKNRSSLVSKEYMIQSMSYSLLTIYSNNPQNCSALEETYNFLPTLILAIPSITMSDSISAVLTALNFVCLCVESCAGLPMTALCASCATIIQQALRRINETDSDKAFSPEEEASVALQLDLVFQTVEGIMRNNARYAMVMLNSGFLHYAIYDPFVNLCTQVLLGAEVKAQSIPIFGKVVQILLSIIAKTSEAADEVRDSGLTLIIKNLVSSKPVSREFSQMLLRLTKTLARSDESHLKDSFNTIFTTIQAVESDFGKLRQLADTLAVILLENEDSPALCYLMGGMEYTVGSLNSFFDKFSEFIVVYGVDYTQSAQVMELVHSLEAVMRVLSFQITLSSPHPTDAEFATKNLVFRKYYDLIADSLFNSGIFSSAFTDRGLDFVFHLIAGFTDRIDIVNAGAVEILVKLMARFDSALFNVALVRFCEYAESSETASKVLNETGIVCQLIEYFHPIFHDTGVSYDHPIFKLFRLLTQTYLTVDSFVALFKYIVRPVVLPGESDFQLMLPWESFSAEQSSASWRALQYLTDITTQSKDRVQNVPFIGLGTVHSVQKWTPAYLTASFNSTTNLTFPANGFTYSCWYKWPEQEHAAQQDAQVGEVIPILSLSAGDCFFEVHVDLDRSFVRVASLAKNGAVSSLLFKPVMQLSRHDWTSLVLIVKKTKKLTTGSKVSVAVHINGINCDPETTDTVNVEPTVFSAPIITMDVGRLALTMSRFAPDVHIDDAKSMRILSVPIDWHLGPLYLFEEVLTPEQVVNIFMKGPKYTGMFTAESPLTDHPTSIACHLLYRCNSSSKTADICLDMLGLASLEHATTDSHSEREHCEFEFPVMLAPVLALNATSIVLNREKKLPSVVADADGNLATELDSEGTITIDGDVCQQIPANRFLLTNTASLEVKHHASLENGYFHCNSVSVADCLAAIGGPETLFPLLQAASNESQICLALHMIHYSVRHNVANLRYMQSEGYKIVAFILSIKQSSILTEAVVEALMRLAVDRSRAEMRSWGESLFLVDTSAFFHLLLNHHVWEVRRFNITFSIVSKMLALTVDERYSVQNARRLSSLNATRWVIMICAYSVGQLDPQPQAEYYEMATTPPPSRGHGRKSSWTEKDLSDIKEDWLFQYPTANQMAEYRDTSDSFLQESMNLVKRVINIDIRKKDIELLAKMVMYTFRPVKSARKGQPSSRRSSPRPQSTASSAASTTSGVPRKRDWRMRTSSADITDNGTINLAELGEDGESVGTSCPFCNYNEGKTYSYDGDDQPYENVFTPMCVFRVYLLRLLFSVYDNYLEELRWGTNQAAEGGPRKSIARNIDKDVFEYFRSACSPAWFLAVLEQNGQDIATKTHCLRLLGLFLQKDAQFLREFSACDGFKIMHTTLTVEAQEISVVLPLIAMLFRIPIQVLLHPFQIKSVDKFLQVLNLEECLGCDTQEPGLSDLTIPLLSLLFDCLTNACRAKDDPTKQFVPLMDLLLGVLRFAMSKMNSFKALIQRRSAVEILSIAVLSCSDGFNDFGTHIYRNNDDLTSDLSCSVKEDYISTPPSTPPPSGKTAYDVPRTADVRLIQATDPSAQNLEIEMVGTEGEKMIDIVSMSLHYAVMELENVHTLIYYLISYPVGFLSTYEYGFQKLIVSTFSNVVNNLTSKSFEPVLMLHITDLIVNLIPLVRANILFDAVLFDVFKLTIALTRIAIDVPYSNSQDRVRSVIKEIGSTARFFSFACISKNFERTMRNTVFSIIRENLDILFHPALEDIADVGLQAAGGMFPRRLGAENGVGTGNAAVLEAVQALGVGLGNPKKVSVWSTAYVKADRNRISSVFWVYMTSVCYGMVLEDDSAVRIDATRILAYLSVNRGTLMEQVLGNFTMFNTAAPRMWKTSAVTESPQETADKASKEVDIFRDGFSKLVPDAAGNYEIFRRGATDDNESEENRFADFSFWISDNNVKCDKIFFAIDAALQWLVPPTAELEEIRRQLEYVSANHTAAGLTAIQSNARGKDHIDAGKNALAATEKLRRTEAGTRQGDHIVQLVSRFQTFGLSSLASGALSWGSTWHAAQSSPIWGYLPLKQLRRDRGQEDTPTVGSGDGFFGHVDRHNENEEQEFKKAWYLNFTEGPEGMRRKLEQDFSVPLPLHANQKKDSSRKAAILLDDRSAASAGSSDKKIDESVDITANEDMEDFLKKIAREGLIKRVDAEEEDFEGADGDEAAYLALQTERRSLTAGDAPTAVRRRSSAPHAAESAESGDTPAMLERDIVTSINELVLGASGDKADQSDPRAAELSLEMEDEGDGDFGEMSPIDQDESMSISKRLEDDISTEDCIETSKLRRSAMLAEIVKGVIGASEWAKGNVYNVRRIYALEAHSALLVITPNNMHFLCGFVATKTQKSSRSTAPTAPTCVLEWVSPQQQKEHFDKVNTTNRPQSVTFAELHDTDWTEDIWKELLRNDLGYSRFPLSDIYSFFRRRHQLKYTAMEVTDVMGYSVLYSCESVVENEQILVTLLQSELPSSIFNRVIGIAQLQLLRSIGSNVNSNITSNVYNRLVSLFVNQVTALWQHGELSNFEYLMHINAAAGRSFQDLTQYPVFPWVIADYASETLDFDNPATFRDLTKPMGAIGPRREQQYRDRYQTMDEFFKDGIEGSSPPFFYGTHYSCAGYVLHYLLRVQPYADMSVALQGGTFDKADRLFLSVENSWISASQENLQDVRELIPEFYYLPEFLCNANKFDLGSTQREAVVQDVVLPIWAHGDPQEYIRIQREALESKYVSQNLHHWIDLIFGFKQRGQAAIDSLNVFIHLTYEGEIDVDAITDPIMRTATISQINNFGQTPSRVFRKPHPQKVVPDSLKRIGDGVVADPNALFWQAHLSPPLSVVGAPAHSILNKISFVGVTYFGNVRGLPVGDVRLMRDRLIAVPAGSALVGPYYKRAIRYGGVSGGVTIQSIQNLVVGTRALDNEKENTEHEDLHQKPVSCLAVSKNGAYFATGSEDTSVRVWQITKRNHQRHVSHVCTLVGHTASVTCIDISTEFSIVVSGGADGVVCVWDYRLKRMLRLLGDHKGPLISVSMNAMSGVIATLTVQQLRLYTINGELVSYVSPANPLGFRLNGTDTLSPPCVVLAAPCGAWQDGVVLVTGHKDGYLYLWKLSKPVQEGAEEAAKQQVKPVTTETLLERKVQPYVTTHNRAKFRELYIAAVPVKIHKANITVLKLCSTVPGRGKDSVAKTVEESRALELLVGDADGFVSRWAPLKLDTLASSDLMQVLSSTGGHMDGHAKR